MTKSQERDAAVLDFNSLTSRIDYYGIMEEFMSRSLRARIRSGGYSEDVLAILIKLDEELTNLIMVQARTRQGD